MEVMEDQAQDPVAQAAVDSSLVVAAAQAVQQLQQEPLPRDPLLPHSSLLRAVECSDLVVD